MKESDNCPITVHELCKAAARVTQFLLSVALHLRKHVHQGEGTDSPKASRESHA